MQAGKTEIIFSRNKLFHQFSSHNIEKIQIFHFTKLWPASWLTTVSETTARWRHSAQQTGGKYLLDRAGSDQIKFWLLGTLGVINHTSIPIVLHLSGII